MKRIAGLFFLLFLCYSCDKDMHSYTIDVFENNQVNVSFVKNLNQAEKALLCGYLFSYGNECQGSLNKIKCKILKTLSIDDECDKAHIEFLKKWFVKDEIMKYKLNKCPNLSIKGAIQNSIERIIMCRNSDTLSIEFHVKGLNTSQEKKWNIEEVKKYILQNKILIPI